MGYEPPAESILSLFISTQILEFSMHKRVVPSHTIQGPNSQLLAPHIWPPATNTCGALPPPPLTHSLVHMQIPSLQNPPVLPSHLHTLTQSGLNSHHPLKVLLGVKQWSASATGCMHNQIRLSIQPIKHNINMYSS